MKLTSKDTGKDIRDVTKNRQFTKAGINDMGIGGGSCRLNFEEVVKTRHGRCHCCTAIGFTC